MGVLVAPAVVRRAAVELEPVEAGEVPHRRRVLHQQDDLEKHGERVDTTLLIVLYTYVECI